MPKEHLVKKSFKHAICTSRGILRMPGLGQLIDAKKFSSTLGLNQKWQFGGADLIVDWGNKRRSKIVDVAERKNIPILSLEDGFIRSLGLGVEGSRSFSVISDWSGIYYDATGPSDLENLLQDQHPKSIEIPSLIERSKRCIDHILRDKISKYNHAPDISLGEKKDRRVLLIDQTEGDRSILSGMADHQSFEKMLSDALEETAAEIVIKTHPDVIAGKKRGYLGNRNYPENVRLVAENCNPVSLLKQVDDVRVVTSQMGFEACMLGIPVTCYGVPFYSSWGFTNDKKPCKRRTKKRSVEEVFAAAYLLYPRYFHPETSEPCELEAVLNHISFQKRFWEKNQGKILCIGFDNWKHSYVRHFLRSPSNEIRFAKNLTKNELDKNTQVVVWGNSISASDREFANTHSAGLFTMEDGFIRSVQLGKYGAAPRSLVIDSRGIYFDPSISSDLEVILENKVFTEGDEQRAAHIRERLIEQKISKYNIGDQQKLIINSKPDQKIILVPGQVNTDASIAKGCSRIKSNIELLGAVRQSNPHAYILYKPHPDVVSGNIVEASESYSEIADQIESHANIHSCIDIADEVHTMTSLVGFEALLKNKSVYCYGSPFYSGWGLTSDKNELATNGRTRKLTLNQLVAGTLIHYPRYIDISSGEFVGAEQALNAIQTELTESGMPKLQGQFWYRWLLKIRHGGLGMLRNWF